jgi:cell division protein FtsB
MSEGRSFQSLLTAGLVALLLLLGAAGLKSYQDFELAQAQEAELRGKIAAEKARIAELAERVERLDKDPRTLERLAREALWMGKPGEVVILLPGSSTTSAANLR